MLEALGELREAFLILLQKEKDFDSLKVKLEEGAKEHFKFLNLVDFQNLDKIEIKKSS